MMASPPAPSNFRNFAKIARMPSRFSSIVLVGQDAAAFVLAGGIADPRGAAAHQRDRPVAGLLQPVQHHDRQQRADMQRGRGAVEADIGGDRLAARERVERLGLRDLMDEAAAREDVAGNRTCRRSSAVSCRAGWCHSVRRGGVTGPAADFNRGSVAMPIRHVRSA